MIAASVAELAYASDLKSDALTGLWVRVPPEAQTKRCTVFSCVAPFAFLLVLPITHNACMLTACDYIVIDKVIDNSEPRLRLGFIAYKAKCE